MRINHMTYTHIYADMCTNICASGLPKTFVLFYQTKVNNIYFLAR